MNKFRHLSSKKSNVSYRLYAMNQHYGGINGGHYRARVMNLDDNKWYDCDDSKTTAVEEKCDEHVFSYMSAYILFYEMIEEKKIEEEKLKNSSGVDALEAENQDELS